MRIVVDIETNLFSEEFKNAKSLSSRRKFAPSPRLAYAYSIEDRKYFFFSRSNLRRLLKLLRKADEIITYNGDRFDFIVLEKFFNLKRRDIVRRRSTDLCKIVFRKTRSRIKLDTLTKLNLNEEKKLKIRNGNLPAYHELKSGCKSDVRQTYKLFKLWEAGTLKLPQPREEKFYTEKNLDECDFPLVNQNKPKQCPHCHEKNSLLSLEIDQEEYLTEGQEADYHAGLWGYAKCLNCEEIIYWNI